MRHPSGRGRDAPPPMGHISGGVSLAERFAPGVPQGDDVERIGSLVYVVHQFEMLVHHQAAVEVARAVEQQGLALADAGR